jgi:hypothetical protein
VTARINASSGLTSAFLTVAPVWPPRSISILSREKWFRVRDTYGIEIAPDQIERSGDKVADVSTDRSSEEITMPLLRGGRDDDGGTKYQMREKCSSLDAALTPPTEA